jgi:hypothetical protein
MPRTWWSPSRGWFGEVGRETFALVPDYDGPGELPEDAAELVQVVSEGAAFAQALDNLRPGPDFRPALEADCGHVEHSLFRGFEEYDWRDTWCGRRANPGAFERTWEPCPRTEAQRDV